MNTYFKSLLDYGKYYRIWPNGDVKRNKLYVSVGLSRPSGNPVCKLFISQDHGDSWIEIADFHSLDKRNTTTGQPFVTNEGAIFVPVWNASFYTHGETWFAIYRIESHGASWKKVYEDSKGTYGNHFFQNPVDGSLHIGVGVGGGGSKGRIGFSPEKSYLLRSEDFGDTWKKVFEIDYPTALYDGTTLDENTILVTARERKSVFISVDRGISWSEVHIGKTTRNISYIGEMGKSVLTSNSCIFLLNNNFSWTRFNTPIKDLALRYPIFDKNKLYVIGVGWRSYVIATDFSKWYAFDITERANSNSFARMTMLSEYMFLGDELKGVLLRWRLPIRDNGTIGRSQMLVINMKCIPSMIRRRIKGTLKRSIDVLA